jgi:uncharacterized protein (DUF924 family)
VVGVASELFGKAQEEARAMYGFPFNHTDILAEHQTAVKLNEFLGR